MTFDRRGSPKRRIVRAHFAAATLLLSIAACAAPNRTELSATPTSEVSTAPVGATDSDSAPISKPSLHSGDVWIDKIQGADREFRIDAVHGDTMEVNFWGSEMTTDSSLNIFVYRSLTESSSEPTVSTKPGMWFAFPLYPGKTWEGQYDWEMQGAAPVRGSAAEHGKVVGWEDIQVPAGTFHALKCEVHTRFFVKGGMADEETVIFWYSPKANRFVKFEHSTMYEGQLVAEMVSYRPAK